LALIFQSSEEAKLWVAIVIEKGREWLPEEIIKYADTLVLAARERGMGNTAHPVKDFMPKPTPGHVIAGSPDCHFSVG
jgi:hypothetical protein